MAAHLSKAAQYSTLLLLLLSAIHLSTTCARLLDEVPLMPELPPPDATPPPADTIPTPPETTVLPTPTDAPQLTDPLPAASAPVVPPDQPTPAATQQPPINGAAAALPAGDRHHALMTFFMHDVLGGTKPSARIVTGIVSSTDFSGQIPFSQPNQDVFPIAGAVPLPNGATVSANSLPYLTGLGGGASTIAGGIAQTNDGSILGGDSSKLPFVAGDNLPMQPALEALLFGTTTVIDDELTEGRELGSAVIGRAQGFYIASSKDGTSQTVMFTASLGGGGGGAGDAAVDTLSFFGVHRKAVAESHVAVVGGTGNYENARGYAAIQTMHPVDQHSTDGAETLLQLSVHLS